ncbi:hypothetical protein MTO96_014750 [Rhipicephalus appendiculatus]
MRKDLEKYHDPHRCTAQRPQCGLLHRKISPCQLHTLGVGHRGCGSIDVHYSLLSTPGYAARNLHSFTAKEQALTWEHHAIYVDCESCYIGRHHYARNEALTWEHHAIYVDCESCYIGRHHYARNGYGCTMWLPATPLSKESTEYCDFIFDVFCGSAPKFYMYNPSCPALLEKAASGGRSKA